MFMAVLVSSGRRWDVSDPIITAHDEEDRGNPFVVFLGDLIWAQTLAENVPRIKLLV